MGAGEKEGNDRLWIRTDSTPILRYASCQMSAKQGSRGRGHDRGCKYPGKGGGGVAFRGCSLCSTYRQHTHKSGGMGWEGVTRQCEGLWPVFYLPCSILLALLIAYSKAGLGRGR